MSCVIYSINPGDLDVYELFSYICDNLSFNQTILLYNLLDEAIKDM